MKPIDILLYSAVVFGWSTSWLPLKWQAVDSVAPEVSVMWRFILAASVMTLFCLVSGRSLKLPGRAMLMAGGMGVCIFSTNFMLFYYGAYGLPSGLLAVIFATVSLISLFYSRLVLGTPLTTLSVFAALIGFSGVALMYWPEIRGGQAALVSLGFCIAGTLLFSTGSIISGASQRAGFSVVATSTWGMWFGAAWMLVLSLVRGKTLGFELTWQYMGGIAWLAIFSSVIAFAAYLTLLGRIGPGRAGYATVLFPPFALLISTFVEGYQWTWMAFVGLAMVLGGVFLINYRRG